MWSSESSSESSYYSEDSQASFAEVEHEQSERELQVSCWSSDDMADDQWLKNYEKEKEENMQLEKELQARLDATVQVDSW